MRMTEYLLQSRRTTGPDGRYGMNKYSALTVRTIVALLIAGVATAAFAGPAAAAGTGRASCGHANGTGPSGTVTFSGCTNFPHTGGSGTTPEITLGESGGESTIEWAAGRGTTTISVTWAPPSKPHGAPCPTGAFESDGTGTVTADTGFASSIAIGGTVMLKVCISSSFGLTLEPNTRFKF